MTNFAQPVSMPCMEEQYKKDLKEGLEKLGYKMNIVFGNNMFYIGTNFDYQNYIGGTMPFSSVKERNRHFIPEYNPELFLAIAGMREGNEVHVGEWMMCLKALEYPPYYKSNELCRINILEKGGSNKGEFGQKYNRDYFRKATLSELINHFKKEKNMNYEQIQRLFNYIADLTGHNCLSTEMQEIENIILHDQLPKKEHSFKFGDKVKAWDFEGSTKYDFIFVSKIECEFPYLLADSESWMESLHMGKGCHLVQRKHCIPFPGPLKITLKEIAEWKGTDNFEIT